jgi:hypothetical protein
VSPALLAAAGDRGGDTVVAWAFLALQVTGVALGWIYFFAPPVAFSIAVAPRAGWATRLPR